MALMDDLREKGLPWWPIIAACVSAVAVSASTTAATVAKTNMALGQHESRLDRFDNMAEDRGTRLVRMEQQTIDTNRRLERIEAKLDQVLAE